MNQIVQIDLATTTTTAYENFSEIKKAIENAALGLYSKYDVQIKDVQAVGEQVIMHVMIPDSIAADFQIGYHLRGVSAYLMKHFKEKYSKFIVSKKLLVYTVIPTTTYTNDTEITVNDRLSAIGEFAELLKNTDEKSMNKITRIIDIFKED